MILVDVFKAMQAGKEIKDPAKWKNVQNTANQLTILVTFLVSVARVAGVDVPLTDEQLISIAGAFAVLMGVFNSVMTAITTKKISITGKIHTE